MYFENFIQNDKMIKYLFDQDIVITVKFFNNSSTLEKYYSSYQRRCLKNKYCQDNN